MKYFLFATLMFLTINKLQFQDSEPTITSILDYFETIYNIPLPNDQITAYGEETYQHAILPSLLPYLFESLEITENIAPKTNHNRPGKKKPKKMICVHDTGSFMFNAEGWSRAVHEGHLPDGTLYDVSYHYVVGNDGYWHNIPDDEIAWHAGDGTQYDYEEFPTDVLGSEPKPNITISEDGYFEINGKKSNITAPRKGSEILKSSDINDMGIRVIIHNNRYFLGRTWYSPIFKKIGNRGGNVNSIGIESCLDKGTDIFYTWMKTAKLVAYLMDEYNLNIEDVVGHHFFSGKECPQTIRRNNFWNYFKYNMVLKEFEILQFLKKGFVITFDCDDKEFVSDKGKLIKLPENDKEIQFYVIVSKDGFYEKRLFKKIIKGKNK